MKFSHVIVAACAVFAAGQAPAMANECNDWTIAGSYAAHGQGFTGTAAPFSPVSFVASRLFDGYGNFRGAGYSVTAGVPLAFSSTGTYQVNGDCTIKITGTITTGGGNDQFRMVVENGNKIYTTRYDKGQTVSIEYDRIRPFLSGLAPDRAE